MIKAQLGKQIATLRKRKSLTQEKLAERTGYSVEFISLVERGINAPAIEGCEKIAIALDVKLKKLFDFET